MPVEDTLNIYFNARCSLFSSVSLTFSALLVVEAILMTLKVWGCHI